MGRSTGLICPSAELLALIARAAPELGAAAAEWPAEWTGFLSAARALVGEGRVAERAGWLESRVAEWRTSLGQQRVWRLNAEQASIRPRLPGARAPRKQADESAQG